MKCCVAQDESGTRRRRRRLRALPWSWDSDSESDGPEQSRQRSFTITQVDASSDEEVLVRSNRGRHVVPRTDGELPVTVPASQTALNEVGRWVSEQVPLHVVDALEEDLDRGQAPFSRRVVLHPQSSGGTPRSVQDRSPEMSMRGNSFAALAGAETVAMPDMDDAVATQPAQVPLPTWVDEEPLGEYPRQRRWLQLICQSQTMNS